MNIKTIGVAGAGVMGQGVAFQFARYGYPVILLDVDTAHLEHARQQIRGIQRHAMLFQKGAPGAEALNHITFTDRLEDLAPADFWVENITENLALKEAMYARIRDVIRDEAVIAVNTSAVSITRAASWLRHPERVLGIHFMNPVHMKPSVEVIRGWHTTDATLTTALDLLQSVNMKGIVVKDYPGFVSNRVLMLTVNEAVFTVQDGVASPEDVDRIFVECFSHKMGPLATADLIGLDTILYTLEVLFESYNDPKFRPAPLLRKMVDAGLLGRKSGEGFFQYAQ